MSHVYSTLQATTIKLSYSLPKVQSSTVIIQYCHSPFYHYATKMFKAFPGVEKLGPLIHVAIVRHKGIAFTKQCIL